MDMKLISALIDKVNASGLKSFEIEENGLRIKLENAFPASHPGMPTESGLPVPPVHPASATLVPADAEETEQATDILIVTAPLVGIFYPLEECGKEALVPGDRVEVGQIVCAIEAMKLVNEVESTAAGLYVETLVKSGEQVEFGQPIMKIRKG